MVDKNISAECLKPELSDSSSGDSGSVLSSCKDSSYFAKGRGTSGSYPEW